MFCWWGVNSDQSIKKIKNSKPGPARPLQPLEARLKVLAGLESVDFLVTFSEETPIRLIQSLRPHVIVKDQITSQRTLLALKRLKAGAGLLCAYHFTVTTRPLD